MSTLREPQPTVNSATSPHSALRAPGVSPLWRERIVRWPACQWKCANGKMTVIEYKGYRIEVRVEASITLSFKRAL
jgi:hypothetical protein